MIKNIQLKNFKCYQSQHFQLADLTVFCGNNSVGKSSAIQSLLMAIQADFAELLPFYGEMISVGAYSDVHNRFADADSLSLTVDTEYGLMTWGYDLDDFDSHYYQDDVYSKNRNSLEDSPLPQIIKSERIDESIRKKLRGDFQYLCAERLGPRNNYPCSTDRRSQHWLGIHGEYISQVLAKLPENKLLLPQDDARKHTAAASFIILENLNEWIGEISPGVDFNSTAIKQADIALNEYVFGSQKYRPVNVGFGLSYALPIVTALLLTKPGGLVIVENPEAHLHPRGQSYLGRLMAYAALAGVQVIVETHSEHIINGMRVIARLHDAYVAGQFKIFFIAKEADNQVTVEDLPVGVKGDLDKWPKGFFDQQAMDIKTLIKGKEVID